MSKSTKQSKSSSKTARMTALTANLMSAVSNAVNKNEPTTEQPTTEPKPEQPKPVAFYELVKLPTPDGIKSRQLRLVVTALQGVQFGDAPQPADNVIALVAAAVGDSYKVRNGDVAGSVGFHLHQLSRQGVLRKLRMTQTEGGWIEVTSKEAE